MNINLDTTAYQVINLNETDSTSRYLTDLCRESVNPLPEMTTVTALYQTAGKGQRGNSWESEAGKNLLFSLVLYPSFLEARQQFVLSQLISLAIKEELSYHAPDFCIKWPNDIYWRDKKICGILIENEIEEGHISRCICGIGININQEEFVSPAPNPISLYHITDCRHELAPLLLSILRRIHLYYEELRNTDDITAYFEEIGMRYASSLFRRNGYHSYRDAQGGFLARLLHVEPNGRIVLEDDAGTRREYLFKEVQYIL